MATREFELSAAPVFACIVLVVWTLPNAPVFYKRRAKFTEDAEPKKAQPIEAVNIGKRKLGRQFEV